MALLRPGRSKERRSERDSIGCGGNQRWVQKSSYRWLIGVLCVVVLLQTWVMYTATGIHSRVAADDWQHISVMIKRNSASGIHEASMHSTHATNREDGSGGVFTDIGDNNEAYYFPKPRILIGIIGNAGNYMGKVYRWRHRRLIELWNDTRICSLHDFEMLRGQNNQTKANPKGHSINPPLPLEEDNIPCQIVYTFVIGGHNSTSGVPTYLLDNSRPMELNRNQVALLPRYKDVNQTDITLLNIAENMNDGKTPTFFYWASRTARRLGIDYVVKCDSDALLRLNALLQFLHRELPWRPLPRPSQSGHAAVTRVNTRPPLTMMGAFRHKAFWNKTADETFWQKEYHQGTHIYLAGQLYLISVEVADYLIEEARSTLMGKKNRSTDAVSSTSVNTFSYIEGHEDHDATSMIQLKTPHVPIRWLSMPRHYKFWEHPVKGEYWWKRILKREKKKIAQGKTGLPYHLPNNRFHPFPLLPSIEQGEIVINAPMFPSGGFQSRTLLLVLGCTTSEQQQAYVQRWQAKQPERHLCKVFLRRPTDRVVSDIGAKSHSLPTTVCDIFYAFVVGGNPIGPTEIVCPLSSYQENASAPNLVAMDWNFSPSPSSKELPVWPLDIRENMHEGMGVSALCAVEHFVPDYRSSFDMVMLMQADYLLDLDRWRLLEAAQSSPHGLVLGDLRDKDQVPREFSTTRGNESFWFQEFENIHLYLGSECLVFGTSLIAGILEQARTNTGVRSTYWVGNLGHDLTTLAYHIPRTILHWVPINKSLRFWNPLVEAHETSLTA